MQSSKQIVQSFALNIGLKSIGLVIGLYQLYWITGLASVNQYYQYNFVGAYLSIITLVAGFGIYSILQKEWTNTSDTARLSRVWTTLFALRIATVLVGLVVALILTLAEVRLPFLLTGLMFFQGALVLIDYNYFALYASRSEVWKFNITDLVGKLVSLAILLLYFAGIHIGDNPVYHFVTAQIVGVVVALGCDIIWNKRVVVWGKFDPALLKSLMPQLLLIALSWFVLGLYQQTQAITLSWLGLSEVQVNGFVQAFVLINQGILAVAVLNTQIASNIKQHADKATSTQQRLQYFWKYMGLYLGVLLVAYIAVVVLGPIVLRLIDIKAKYLELSAPLLPILGIYLVANSLTGVLTYLNVFYHQEVSQVTAVVLQLVFSAILLLTLVPWLGLTGAAWAVSLVAVLDVVVVRLPLTLRVLKAH
jgi:O-antigen/teichoic acid export membrane protein